jgi:mycothiol synthase
VTVEPATAPAATTTLFRTRPFGGPADLARMQALQREGWRRLGPIAESHPGDLEWWMYGLSDPQDDQSTRICLWETDGGELRGWSWIFRGELQWFVHPDERDGELREQMLEWHAITLGELTPDTDEATLTTWSTTRQPELGHELARRGFGADGHVLVHYTLDLRAADVAAARRGQAAPLGYTIRAFAGQADIPQRVAVHRSAFHPSRLTEERYTRVLAAPTYWPDLDIVAVAPDGMFAAFCLCWYDEESRVGLLEPVGAHEAHRRRGLAWAVCAEALRRLRSRGAERASVLSHADNEASMTLYRSLGFVEVMRSVEWTRRAGDSGVTSERDA